MDLLPEELLIEIIFLLEVEDIIMLNQSSKHLNNLSNQNIIKDDILTRFPNDTIVLSDFSLKQLHFYSKIYKLKRKMDIRVSENYNNEPCILSSLTVCYGNHLYILLDNIITKLNRNNINKIITVNYTDYDDESENLSILLTDDGKLYYVENEFTLYNLNNLELNNSIETPDKVIDIYALDDMVVIITKNGLYLNWHQKTLSKNFKTLKLIRSDGYYYLTDEGEVYILDNIDIDSSSNSEILVNNKFQQSDIKYNFRKLRELPKIKQTSRNFLLSNDDIIYYRSPYDEETTESHSLNNIIQISQFFSLNNNGKVMYYNHELVNLTNVIEINNWGNVLYCLNNKMQLYIVKYDDYNLYNELIIYDLNVQLFNNVID